MRKTPFILIFILIACSDSPEGALMLQSAKIHEETLQISKEVVEKIREVNPMLSELRQDQSFIKDSLAVLKQDFIDWESTIVGIPGHEHEHHDHSGHNYDHSHAPTPGLTPKMLLEVQRGLRDQVVKLNIRAQEIVNELENTNEK